MEATMFKLVTTDDRTRVFALGIWIRSNDGSEEAVTYRRDPRSGQTMFSIFGTPEAARARHSSVVPLSLEWSDEPTVPDLRECRGRHRLRPRDLGVAPR